MEGAPAGPPPLERQAPFPPQLPILMIPPSPQGMDSNNGDGDDETADPHPTPHVPPPPPASSRRAPFCSCIIDDCNVCDDCRINLTVHRD